MRILGNNILVEIKTEEVKENTNRIIITPTKTKGQTYGEVVLVGEGVEDKDCIKVGDKVVWCTNSPGTSINISEDKLNYVFHFKDIIAVL